VLTCDLTKEYVAINGDYRSWPDRAEHDPRPFGWCPKSRTFSARSDSIAKRLGAVRCGL